MAEVQEPRRRVVYWSSQAGEAPVSRALCTTEAPGVIPNGSIGCCLGGERSRRDDGAPAGEGRRSACSCFNTWKDRAPGLARPFKRP